MSKVIQSGNSLAVTIPKKFAKMVGVKKGDDVKVERKPQNGELILKFSGAQQLILNTKVLKTSLP